MRRRLRLTAVCAVVLISLTGFKGRGHGHGGDGGGGGCSGSHHSSSSSSSGGSGGYRDDYDDDDDPYLGSSSGGYTPTTDDTVDSGGDGSTGQARVEESVDRCVYKDGSAGYVATVKLYNPGTEEGRVYALEMRFYDKSGKQVTTGEAFDLTVPAGETKIVEIRPEKQSVAGTITRCEVV